MNFTARYKQILFFMMLVFCLGFRQGGTDAIGLSFTSKMLENKKYVTVEGEVFFKKQGGIMTTHLRKPFENVTIVTASGDVKNYDVPDNTVILSSSAYTSSESSYFWHFMNGNYNDLGLKKLGYVIQSTTTDEGALVTTWIPKAGANVPLSKVILAHEKSLPVYMEFVGPKQKTLGKIFFSSYQKVGSASIPFTITEIGYKEKGDSVVTAKTYSNPKINAQVDPKYLDFKIPSNAKVVSDK
jgi:outer membrane lipoprotein-sorting protein